MNLKSLILSCSLIITQIQIQAMDLATVDLDFVSTLHFTVIESQHSHEIHLLLPFPCLSYETLHKHNKTNRPIIVHCEEEDKVVKYTPRSKTNSFFENEVQFHRQLMAYPQFSSIEQSYSLEDGDCMISQAMTGDLFSILCGHDDLSCLSLYEDEDRVELLSNRETYARQMIESVAMLQHLGLYHRDVKPDNFLVDLDEKRVRLHDFEFMAKKEEEKLSLCGTLNYCTVERLKDANYNHSYDEYSLYLSLFFLYFNADFFSEFSNRDKTLLKMEKFADFKDPKKFIPDFFLPNHLEYFRENKVHEYEITKWKRNFFDSKSDWEQLNHYEQAILRNLHPDKDQRSSFEDFCKIFGANCQP